MEYFINLEIPFYIIHIHLLTVIMSEFTTFYILIDFILDLKVIS